MQQASLAMRAQSKPEASKRAIVNISSTAALASMPGLTAYSAAKAAIRQLSRSAAVELAPFNVRCMRRKCHLHAHCAKLEFLANRRHPDLVSAAEAAVTFCLLSWQAAINFSVCDEDLILNNTAYQTQFCINLYFHMISLTAHNSLMLHRCLPHLVSCGLLPQLQQCCHSCRLGSVCMPAGY